MRHGPLHCSAETHALALLAALFATSCAPSVRLVHRSNVYFERCYAADLDRLVPNAERRACWSAWQEHYPAGQSRERLDYVRERLLRLDPERAAIVALATGEDPELAPELGMSSDPQLVTEDAAEPDPASETTDVASTEAPAEDGAADEESREEARARRAGRRPIVPRTATPHCAAACEPRYQTCATRCGADGRACLTACRVSYRQCARACY